MPHKFCLNGACHYKIKWKLGFTLFLRDSLCLGVLSILIRIVLLFLSYLSVILQTNTDSFPRLSVPGCVIHIITHYCIIIYVISKCPQILTLSRDPLCLGILQTLLHIILLLLILLYSYVILSTNNDSCLTIRIKGVRFQDIIGRKALMHLSG